MPFSKSHLQQALEVEYQVKCNFLKAAIHPRAILQATLANIQASPKPSGIVRTHSFKVQREELSPPDPAMDPQSPLLQLPGHTALRVLTSHPTNNPFPLSFKGEGTPASVLRGH